MESQVPLMLASPNLGAYLPTYLPACLSVWWPSRPPPRPQTFILSRRRPTLAFRLAFEGCVLGGQIVDCLFLERFGEQKLGCVGLGGSDGIAGTEFEEYGLGGERSEEAKHDAELGKQAIGEGHPMEGGRLSVSGGRRVRQGREQQPHCSVETDNVHQPVRKNKGWSSGDFVTGNNWLSRRGGRHDVFGEVDVVRQCES